MRYFLPRFMLLLAALFLLIGCAGRPANAPIPALERLPERESQKQKLTFEHDGERQVLIGALRQDGQSVRLALLSPQGQRLLTLVHDDTGSRFLSDKSFDPPFTAEWLASRLSWSLWPASALSQAFEEEPWSLEEERGERTVRYRDRLIARITGDTECRLIEDLEADYRLYIAPLADDADPMDAPCPAN
ncbi:DUF3261 domain-containing protein [Halomonas sp. HL-93]|uniref:DUF3261 domain-containing protein n=1 Tax=Halomonas sp. HL-93 TaxID=1666906 RepID=UPI0006D97CD4|nr:DUF3261 domain-containing protein [Halomonas sp. HL-93]KPQ22674.1 MAG: Protein of unknown function (DUF3261) [Halomonas sp. HL-93]SBR45391.1 Protein of unknown function (DUF3261) [Halomonas sp. HL-93]